MADAIQQLLDSVQEQQRALTTELQRLKQAETFLLQILNPQQKLPKEAPRANVSLSESIRLTLKDLGAADSGAVIRHIAEHYLADVNKNSVRSLLSVWASKGRISKQLDGSYTLNPEKGSLVQANK